MPKANLTLSDFNYNLPQELIAQYPLSGRTQSRLLVLDRAKKEIFHQGFEDILKYLSAEDALVLNNTEVIPARAIGRRKKTNNLGGGKQEIFLIEKLSNDTFRVLAKPAKKITVNSRIFFDEQGAEAVVLKDQGMNKIIRLNTQAKGCEFWHKFGEVPLPPYIKRKPEILDKERYQTVYAKEPGAAAAPTAGLHFSKELLAKIEAKGVDIAYATLHVSYGTFAPVKTEDITKHKMYQERFCLSKKAADSINGAREKKNRIFAVGTTSVRVLESCSDEKGVIRPQEGQTDLFIYPPYKFKAVDSLLTNFHFPKSTLLMLVSAFAGKEFLFQAYHEAIQKKYRFFSYGDAMLIV